VRFAVRCTAEQHRGSTETPTGQHIFVRTKSGGSRGSDRGDVGFRDTRWSMEITVGMKIIIDGETRL
jgi:hypothetical protein